MLEFYTFLSAPIMKPIHTAWQLCYLVPTLIISFSLFALLIVTINGRKSSYANGYVFVIAMKNEHFTFARDFNG